MKNNELTGTDKQIKWAEEILTSKIAAIKSNADRTTGNDKHLSELVNYAAGEIARTTYPEKSDVPKKRELRNRLESTGLAELRSHIVAELESVTNSEWWIDNRSSDVITPIVNAYLAAQ